MNKLIGECSDNYHYSIGKKAIDVDHLILSEETETNRKVPKLLRTKIILAKVTLKVGQEK